MRQVSLSHLTGMFQNTSEGSSFEVETYQTLAMINVWYEDVDKY